MSSPISENKVNVVVDEDLLEKFRADAKKSASAAIDVLTSDQAKQVFKGQADQSVDAYAPAVANTSKQTIKSCCPNSSLGSVVDIAIQPSCVGGIGKNMAHNSIDNGLTPSLRDLL